MSNTKQTCKAKTAAGQPCRAASLAESDFCYFHDPEHEAERRETQAAGGRHGKIKTLPEDTPPVEIKTCADVVSLISSTINQVRTGLLDAGR